MPVETVLLPNYPNPFNPETWIPYHLANPANIVINIYDAKGVLVRVLPLGHQPAGYYTRQSRAAYWDGKNTLGEQVASGIYFYQLETDEHVRTAQNGHREIGSNSRECAGTFVNKQNRGASSGTPLFCFKSIFDLQPGLAEELF